MKMHSLILACGLAALSALPAPAQSAPASRSPRRARPNLEQFEKIAAELQAAGQPALAEQVLKAARELASRSAPPTPAVVVPPVVVRQPGVAGLPGSVPSPAATVPPVAALPPAAVPAPPAMARYLAAPRVQNPVSTATPSPQPPAVAPTPPGAGGAEQRHYHEHHHYYHDAPPAAGSAGGVSRARATTPANLFFGRVAAPVAPPSPSLLGVGGGSGGANPLALPGPNGPRRAAAAGRGSNAGAPSMLGGAVAPETVAPGTAGPSGPARRVSRVPAASGAAADPAAPPAPSGPSAAGPRPPARRALALPGVGLDAEVDGLRREVSELRDLLAELRKTLQARGKSNN